MKVFAGIDSKILRLCTLIAHGLQRAIGVTSYAVAKIGTGISAMSVLLDVVNYFTPVLNRKTGILSLLIAPVLLAAMVLRSVVCQKADDALWSGSSVKPSELIEYMDGYGWRLFWIVLLFVDLFAELLQPPRAHMILEYVNGVGFSMGISMFFYFIAVSPLPPGQSKLRQWVNILGIRRIDNRVEN